MAYRLSKEERLQIESNHELMEVVTRADIIAAKYAHGGQPIALWCRLMAEVKARGVPTTIEIMTFEVTSKAELREYEQLISRIKCGDDGAGARVSPSLLEQTERGGKVEYANVDPSELKSVQRHEALTDFQRAHARSLFRRVGKLLYASFEPWERGFLCDAHPNNELIEWERIARAHALYLARNPACDPKQALSELSTLGLVSNPDEKYPEAARCYHEVIAQMKADIKEMGEVTEQKLAEYLGLMDEDFRG